MKKEDFIYLIYKEYRGMITADEKDHLEYWLSASRENQKTKDDILISMSMLDDYEPVFEVDLEEDFSELQSKITNENTVVKSLKSEEKEIKVFSIKRWMYVAASLVFVLGAVTLFQLGLSGATEMKHASTSNDETQLIELSDGSTVRLNQNSSLYYPSEFDSEERLVKLVGEAYFEVEKDPNRKFEITTDKSRTTVLGTSFNINAYSADEVTTITVKTGKVRFEDLEIGTKEILVAYDIAELSNKDGSITKSKVSTFNNMAWASKRLSFRDAPLTEVIDFLSQFFEVEIDVTEADIEDCTIDMSKQPADLEIILNNIKKVNSIEFEVVSDKKYRLTGGKC